MRVTVLHNDNTHEIFVWDVREWDELHTFYKSQWRASKIKGYEINDAKGKLVAWGGSI